MNKENKGKKKKAGWQQLFSLAIMILTGAVCGIFVISHLELTGASELPFAELLAFLGLIVGVYIALFFHIIVHEAGHLVFGLATGYKFCSFRVGSLIWVKEGGKIRFKRLSLVGTGGQCLMAPPEIKDGKMPLALYNLGGAILNTVVGAVFAVLYAVYPYIPFLSPLLIMLAAIGFMTAVINGVPMRLGTIDNDGYNAFAISRSKEAVEAFRIQLKVVEQTSRGVRVKDMPAEWFTLPSDEAMNNSMVATRAVFAANRLMDEGRLEDADALMAHLLEIESGIVGLHRDLMSCDRITIELLGECRAELIEGMLTPALKKFMRAMKRYPTVLRTEYALALLKDRDGERARVLKDDFEKAARTYPYPQELDSERELLRLIEDRAAEPALNGKG